MSRLSARSAPAIGLVVGVTLAIFGPLGIAVGDYSYVGNYSYGVGAISGVVTDEAGEPLEGVCVTGWSRGPTRQAFTDHDGFYRLTGVTGEAAVGFEVWEACPEKSEYLQQWYDGKPDEDAADRVFVEDGSEETGVDAILVRGGSIAGTVTDTEGSPLRGICVVVDDDDPKGPASVTFTDADGRYRAVPLDTGVYTARFSDCLLPPFGAPSYLAQWFDEKADPENADPVSVLRPGETSGIDARLTRIANTKIDYTGPASTPRNEETTLATRLADVDTGDGVSGQTVELSLQAEGSTLWTVPTVTDASGVATLTRTITEAVGSYTIHAAFHGDEAHRPSSTTAPFEVTRRPTTIDYTGQVSVVSQESANLSAVLQDEATASGLSGKTVTFRLKQGSVTKQQATAVTAADGVASTDVTIAQPAGSYTVEASSSADDTFGAGADTRAFEVTLRPTTLEYSGPATAKANDTVSLSAVLTDDLSGAGIGGRAVTFRLMDGASVLRQVSGITDPSGTVSRTMVLAEPAGEYTITASFAGTTTYAAGSDAAPISIQRRATRIEDTGVTSALYRDDAPIGGVLRDEVTNQGIPGRTVRILWSHEDSETVFGVNRTTNSSGAAGINLSAEPGTYVVEVRFEGDGLYEPSESSRILTVHKRPHTVNYQGPVEAFRGETVVLGARLTYEQEWTWDVIPDLDVEFTLGGTVRTTTTDDEGWAEVEMPVDVEPGSHELRITSGAGSSLWEIATALVDFNVRWEYSFVGQSSEGIVHLNPSTKEFRFELGDDRTEIKLDPDMRIDTLATGQMVVSMSYEDDDVSLTGAFELGSGFFAARVEAFDETHVLVGLPSVMGIGWRLGA